MYVMTCIEYIWLGLRSYVFIYIHMYSYTFICIHIHSYVFKYIHMYSYTFISIHTHLIVFIYICVWTHMNYLYTCVYEFIWWGFIMYIWIHMIRPDHQYMNTTDRGFVCISIHITGLYTYDRVVWVLRGDEALFWSRIRLFSSEIGLFLITDGALWIQYAPLKQPWR